MIAQLVASFSDEFRRLERTLFEKTPSGGAQVVQFTSSNLSEGVTTTVLAFARFLAGTYAPHEVVVVEGNLRRPSFGELLGLDKGHSEPGDAFGRESPVLARARVVNHGFSVIPAGNIPSYGEKTPSQGVGAPPKQSEWIYESFLRGIESTLAELRKNYRCILVDSPPVVPFLDASIIAPMTNGVVIVVQANLTRSEVLDHAIKKIERGGGKVLGIILNKRTFHIPRWLYRFV
jgi:Mrp family chromosome partitioning ATPase